MRKTRIVQRQINVVNDDQKEGGKMRGVTKGREREEGMNRCPSGYKEKWNKDGKWGETFLSDRQRKKQSEKGKRKNTGSEKEKENMVEQKRGKMSKLSKREGGIAITSRRSDKKGTNREKDVRWSNGGYRKGERDGALYY